MNEPAATHLIGQSVVFVERDVDFLHLLFVDIRSKIIYMQFIIQTAQKTFDIRVIEQVDAQ